MTASVRSASDREALLVFAHLHPKVQAWVRRIGWQTLRPAQVRAAAPILEGRRDVIISAATAAGKTEAAFLPICSALVETPRAEPGVEVLAISPLKALINDQHARLEALCADLDLPVHRWHGDVSSRRKRKVLASPDGIVFITPESLEALLVLHGQTVARMLCPLRYVVVDELHAFIDTERGAQLQSLLHRVELILGHRIPRIALSATLGDLAMAAEFLRPDAGRDVVLVAEADSGHEVRLQVKGYRSSAPAPSSHGKPDVSDVASGDQLAVAEHLFKVLRGNDNLVFANSRQEVEIYADLLARLSERRAVPNEFFPHHGSLAKDLREEVEASLKDTQRSVTAICTSTLELGIDIGEMASVAQVGAPTSVSALRQRLGRSGRRSAPPVLRMYIREEAITHKTPPGDCLRTALVQSIAMTQLLLAGWTEPPHGADLHLSTLAQQTLSLIAQHGGVLASDAYATLCGDGPFRRVTKPMFASLLRSLRTRGVIFQAADETLLLDLNGERIVNHHSFYAVFATPDEYRLVANGRRIGSIPVDFPVVPGTLLIFAGRRWRVAAVDDAQKVIDLVASGGGRPPAFTGSRSGVHDRVRAEMLAVYLGSGVPPFLDGMGRELLQEGRDNFMRYGLDQRSVVVCGKDIVLFPWVGDRVMATVAAVLTAGGIEVSNDGAAMTVVGFDPERFCDELAVLVPGGPPEPLELATLMSAKRVGKYDGYLDESLLNAGFASRCLDVKGAWVTLGRLNQECVSPGVVGFEG